MKSIGKAFAVFVAIILSSCTDPKEAADLGFAKDTFDSLTRGDSAVIEDIDWETLTSLGIPVGPQFLAIESVEGKEGFKRGFVTQFSSTFRDSGGSMADFSNWRVTRSDDNITEVTADSQKGSLQLIISERDAKKRLSALKIVRADL